MREFKHVKQTVNRSSVMRPVNTKDAMLVTDNDL